MSDITSASDLIAIITLAYQANLPVLIEGTHGIGKSEIMKQAANALEIGCIVRDLSLMEPPDLIGLPYREKDRTVYAPPDFLPKDKDGRGLLVFEELNRSHHDMLSPCLQLLTERTLSDYSLPKGWLPVAAINPAGEDYNHAQELDPALLSRFMRVRFNPNVRSWLQWAEANGIHEQVLRYVKQTPDVFASSNPRAWTYVSELLIKHKDVPTVSPRVLNTGVGGWVGPEHAAAFFATRNGEVSEISVEDVLKRYSKVKRTVNGWVRAKRTDLLAGLARDLQLALQNGDTAAQISKNAGMQKNLKAVIADLPADLGRGLRSAAKSGGLL